MDTNIPDVQLAPPPVQAIEFPLNPAQMLYQQLEPLALIGMGPAMVAAMLKLGAEVHGLKIAGYRMKILAGPIICHSRTRELQHHPLTNTPEFKHFIVADRHKKAHMPEVLIADGFADLVEGYADCVSYANEREAYEAHATATIEAYIEAAPEAVKMFMVPADKETAN